MTTLAAREIARSLAVVSGAMSERVARIGRASTKDWRGSAHDAMAARTQSLQAELRVVPDLLDDARRALELFAGVAEAAHMQRVRSDGLMLQASGLTRRWQAGIGGEAMDPGAPLRWRAVQMRDEAMATEREAARRAARSIEASARAIRTRSLPPGGPHRNGFGFLDGLDEILDGIVDTVGDGLEWGLDRSTDLASWVADQAEHIVEGMVWVGDKAIEVGQSIGRRFVDEARAGYARARFPVDFALFHATGSTPDDLPNISEAYRRRQNVWSYALIPAIEAGGGECTQLDNGIFACYSKGIELPGDLGTIPLKGRGGTTYGEVFIVDDHVQYERVQEPGSPLAEHEMNHSIQWAVHGPAPFVALYLQDVALSGNNGEDQYFEQQAGAEAGGYD